MCSSYSLPPACFFSRSMFATPGFSKCWRAVVCYCVNVQASQNGLLTIKHVTPEGPASHMSEVQRGDFLVAIDGLTTLGMPMHQVVAPA